MHYLIYLFPILIVFLTLSIKNKIQGKSECLSIYFNIFLTLSSCDFNVFYENFL